MGQIQLLVHIHLQKNNIKKVIRLKKETKHIKSNNKAKGISTVFLIIFIILFIISGTKIIKYIIDNKHNKNIAIEIAKDIKFDDKSDNKKYEIDFKSLKEKNQDTVGFLKVNGTDIESIVVQAQDNSFYLNHNFEKEYNVAGWIFADYHNKFDQTDKNVIIYGHNMRNNTMFGTLKNVLSEDWFENKENRFVNFITESDDCLYEIFSVYQIEAEDYYMKTDFQTGEFKKYIETMKSRSLFDFDTNVNEEDSILTLSTCGNNNKYRVILHARKM